jgi:hypothetical protein
MIFPHEPRCTQAEDIMLICHGAPMLARHHVAKVARQVKNQLKLLFCSLEMPWDQSVFSLEFMECDVPAQLHKYFPLGRRLQESDIEGFQAIAASFVEACKEPYRARHNG